MPYTLSSYVFLYSKKYPDIQKIHVNQNEQNSGQGLRVHMQNGDARDNRFLDDMI